MEQTPCFGTCPVFTLKIHYNGKLEIVGKEYVAFQSIQKQLSDKQLVSIGKLIYESDFFNTSNVYNYDGSGCGSITTEYSSTKWHIIKAVMMLQKHCDN